MIETDISHKPLPVELTLEVKSYDIDMAGIVSNIVYVRWLEDMRLRFLELYHPLEQQVREGYAPIISSTHVDYKRPIRMFDRPVGHMWLEDLGRARWTVCAEIRVGGKLAASARQSGAFINLATLRPIPIPEALAKQFAQAVCAGA